MGADVNLRYEGFLRWAFALGTEKSMVDRWGDPAGLANTDVIDSAFMGIPGNFEKAKAAVAYALCVSCSVGINEGILKEDDEGYINQAIAKCMACESPEQFAKFLEEIHEKVRMKHWPTKK
ncbi:MAG: hypothetical protein K9K65_08890 [Desulfarculaceae bacterium]|nr:hypothetical protein [Desulfarculaceae bacterium]MCF8045901.1 hypothetical protein [Desulfarculaceae bacterium]MCF8097943.1 hypothetical protein [Desulfarculaceae bacterium]MCF8121104.1 hypothetical protein [Desulfarculaceae bacterium]